MITESARKRLQSSAAIVGLTIGSGIIFSSFENVIGIIFGSILIVGGIFAAVILCLSAWKQH